MAASTHSGLSQKHPAILAEFRAGKIDAHKSCNSFSTMAIDHQCREQNNAVIKKSGGAIGLMTDPGALRHWMVAGPEVARMATEFEALQAHNQVTDHRHHEQQRRVQAAFLAVIEEIRNPFLQRSDYLKVCKRSDGCNFKEQITTVLLSSSQVSFKT